MISKPLTLPETNHAIDASLEKSKISRNNGFQKDL